MITCGNCKGKHESVADVKACYNGTKRAVTSEGKHYDVSGVPAFATDPATESQITFAKGLLEAKNLDNIDVGHPVFETMMDVMGEKQVSKREISDLLTALKSCPDKPMWESVPEGRYAITGASGEVQFWQVDRPTQGKWAGRTFINQIVGGVGDWTRLRSPMVTVKWAMEIIERDPRRAAALFGFKSRSCGRCGSPLSRVQSRAAGYGAHCARKAGWPYPGREEARTILAEMAREDPTILDGLDDLEPAK